MASAFKMLGVAAGAAITLAGAAFATERVAALHGAALDGTLDAAGIAHESIRVPSGEKTKSFAELERVIHDLE